MREGVCMCVCAGVGVWGCGGVGVWGCGGVGVGVGVGFHHFCQVSRLSLYVLE